MANPYDYETIPDKSVTSGMTPGVHYRVRDVASDNRIATCYDIANAKLVVRALNALGTNYMAVMREEVAREHEGKS